MPIQHFQTIKFYYSSHATSLSGHFLEVSQFLSVKASYLLSQRLILGDLQKMASERGCIGCALKFYCLGMLFRHDMTHRKRNRANMYLGKLYRARQKCPKITLWVPISRPHMRGTRFILPWGYLGLVTL